MGGGAPTQLTLGIRLDDEARFENFYSSPANRALVAALNPPREPCIYLFGPAGSGRTHLLQALCHAAEGEEEGALYLPLAQPQAQPQPQPLARPLVQPLLQHRQFSPAILEGVQQLALVCIDDVQCIAGEADWEDALFHAFNLMGESGSRLVLAADAPPRRLPLQLADLKSRLSGALVLQLRALGDEDKPAMLGLRAGRRGMDLPSKVAEYILQRAGRDSHSLMALLNRLDRSSLSRQRRLTVPLVREVLEQP